MIKICHLLCIYWTEPSRYLRWLTLVKNYCRVTLLLRGRASFTFFVDSDDQGCDDNQWLMDDWIVITSADSSSRFSGVAAFLRRSKFQEDAISHCTWIPGRLLHIRCQGHRAVLDVVVGYQWVWQEKDADKVARKRATFWTKLGCLCQGLPTRHLLIMGADFNSTARPISGLVGRGLHPTTRAHDPDFEALLLEQKLVLLNTWTSATPRLSRTFLHGTQSSQIDFVLTRRRHADLEAKTAHPTTLDLVPCRLGPKHRPLTCTLPWVPGWFLAPKHHKPLRFSLQALRLSVQMQDTVAQEFQRHVSHELYRLPTRASVQDLNAAILPICRKFYPTTRKPQLADFGQAQVVVSVRNMWAAHRAFRHHRGYVSLRTVMAAWRRFVEFQRASKALRRASRQRRRNWLEHQVTLAEAAAAKGDIAGVYRTINHIAPKKRRDKVRIRSVEGHILSVEQEFTEIYRYFSDAFHREDAFVLQTSGLQLEFTEAEIMSAITELKPGKAVPTTSLPADVWKLCSEGFATRCQQIINEGCNEGFQFPSEATDCLLSLLPKPGRPSRRPKDLRPLGLQDPCSKVLAIALKARLLPKVSSFIANRPQYAYCPNKAIDEAISRVASHCSRVRERLRRGTLSVHAKRSGQVESTCFGGLMLSLDLSRTFDELPRRALLASLQHAGVPDELCAAILSLHETCKYTVMHGSCKGSFRMQKGVRQGCALSSLLYSLYTCWLYDTIASRASADWASRFITLFADDSHISFEVNSLTELGFVVRAIRVVFALFKETGMMVNASKSRVVIGLKGSAARRWLRRRYCRVAGEHAVNFGTALSDSSASCCLFCAFRCHSLIWSLREPYAGTQTQSSPAESTAPAACSAQSELFNAASRPVACRLHPQHIALRVARGRIDRCSAAAPRSL